MPDPTERRQLMLDGLVVMAAERIVEAEARRLACPCGGSGKGGDGCACDPPFTHG